MISDKLVDNISQVPSEHRISRHDKRCVNKDNPVPMSSDRPEVSAHTYRAFYLCPFCLHGQAVWFKKV